MQALGEIEQAEMERVFNMGVGMVLVVAPHFAESIRTQLHDAGFDNWAIGTVTNAAADQQRVVLR